MPQSQMAYDEFTISLRCFFSRWSCDSTAISRWQQDFCSIVRRPQRV